MEDVIIYCVESTAVGIISLSLHFIFITFINLAANNQVSYSIQSNCIFEMAILRNEDLMVKRMI
jgi:hypothetical protein